MSEKEENCENSGEDKTPGIFSWRELATQDVEGSSKFYTELLGWSVNSMEMEGGFTYNMFMLGDRPVAGMVKPPNSDAPPMWMNYITVEDLGATVTKAKDLGASICVPPTEIPGRGKFVGMIDPQGACIAFWQFL